MRFVILIVIVTFAIVVGMGMLWLSGNTGMLTPATQAQSDQPVQSSGGEVATVDVLVARDNIPLGSVLDESMLDRQPWPRHLVLDGFIVSGTPEADILGMVTRAEFKAREPVIYSKLTRMEDASFLASTLRPGMRAVTVAVDSVSGVAGYIFPGDRVDIFLTHSVPQRAGSVLWGEGRDTAARSATTSEVMLANLKVLAVNDRKMQSANENSGRPDMSEPPMNVTLEVPRDAVKKIRLAEKNGTLSLALRSLDDINDNNVGAPITIIDLSRLEGGLGDTKGWSVPKNSRSIPLPSGGMTDEVIIIRGVVEDRQESVRPTPKPDMGFLGGPLETELDLFGQ